MITSDVASFPGLLPPVFVTCSTDVGEGLLRLITYSDIPGHLDVGWTCGGVACITNRKHGPWSD